MSNGDIVEVSSIEADESYLFAQVYSALDLSPEIRDSHKEELRSLGLKQIKEFGGNPINQADQARGVRRALKLINLGLEKAVEKKDQEIAFFDTNFAGIILRNKPLEILYKLGKNIFSEDREVALSLLEKSEIKVDELWYCLINPEELEAIRQITDLDVCRGTISEHKSATNSVPGVFRKMELAKNLPFFKGDLIFRNFKSFGSLTKGNYTSGEGLVDVFLVSLIIACLHRDEEEMFQRKRDLEGRDILKKSIDIARAIGDYESIERLVADSQVTERSMQYDREARYRDKKMQENFLSDLSLVKIEELESFIEMMFWEKEKFLVKAHNIKSRYNDFFTVTVDTLKLKNEGKIYSSTLFLFQELIVKIYEDVRAFYLTIDDPDLKNDEVVKFWNGRVLLKPARDNSMMEGIAKGAENGVGPSELAKMPLDFVLKSVSHFIHWKESRKSEFVASFNPNRFIYEKDDQWNFVVFFRFLDPYAIGWPEQATPNVDSDLRMAIKNCRFGEEQDDKSVVVYEQSEDHTHELLKKIAWEHVHPISVSMLWEYGSDKIRNFISNHCDRIKITTHALKKYYIFEHEDLRLLDFALTELINQDKLKKKAWENLIWLSKDMPRAGRLVMEKSQT